MTERTPEVGEQDVERILCRDYPEANLEEIWEAIRQLQVREKWRVVLARLKNAAGSVNALRKQLDEAPGYYRESIAEAENPDATRRWSRLDELPQAERQSIFDKDWRQYQQWLHRA